MATAVALWLALSGCSDDGGGDGDDDVSRDCTCGGLREHIVYDGLGRQIRYDCPAEGELCTCVVAYDQGSPVTDCGLDPPVVDEADAGADAGPCTGDPPPYLFATAPSDSRADVTPSIATDGEEWLVVWSGSFEDERSDLHFSRSSDAGEIWTEPEVLLAEAIAFDDDPAIATDGSTWVVVWAALHNHSRIRTARSTDGGASWTDASDIDPDEGTDPAIATDGAGRWIAAWGARRDGADRDILLSISRDDGMTWDPPSILNPDADSDTRSDGSPRLASDGSGTWVAVWAGSDEEGDDIYVSRSMDDGGSWSDSLPLTVPPVVAADPDVAARGDGAWLVVWRESQAGQDAADVVSATSTDGGIVWSGPLHVGGTEGDDDTDPSVASDGDGWVVAWSAYHGLTEESDVHGAFSSDGTSWSVPEPLHDDAESNRCYWDLAPALAADRSGRAIAVWGSAMSGADSSDIAFVSFDMR